jgi:hypothetical protein
VDVPKVAVVAPRYAAVELGAAKGYCSPGGPEDLPAVDIASWNDAATSATPHCFNMLLAGALDARDRGEVTHLAMIHSDVEPRGPWLNRLWAEMWAHQAHLVSVVIPIKTMEVDITSTAIGELDDPWKVRRHISTADRLTTLPMTFGPEHCCGPDEVLMVNTGLFFADLRHPAWDLFVGFEFKTRIHPEERPRLAQFRPEDWEMSRHLQAHGARVMGTWAVKVIHHGSHGWKNWSD